jgi:hypothetical protein
MDNMSTATTARKASLKGQTDHELLAMYQNGDEAAQDAVIREMARRDKAAAKAKRERDRRAAARAEYQEYLEWAWVEAEAATNGYMLNKRGIAAGIDPRSLFSGVERRVNAYASEELLAFFEGFGRFTLEYFITAQREGMGPVRAQDDDEREAMIAAEVAGVVAEAEAITETAAAETAEVSETGTEVTETEVITTATANVVAESRTECDNENTEEGETDGGLDHDGRTDLRPAGEADADRAAADQRHGRHDREGADGRPDGHVRRCGLTGRSHGATAADRAGTHRAREVARRECARPDRGGRRPRRCEDARRLARHRRTHDPPCAGRRPRPCRRAVVARARRVLRQDARVALQNDHHLPGWSARPPTARAAPEGEEAVTANADLAQRALDLANGPDRPHALCANVALRTTSSVPAAKQALAQWNGPEDIRERAIRLITELAKDATP